MGLEKEIDRIRRELGDRDYSLIVDRAEALLFNVQKSDLDPTEQRQRAIIYAYNEYEQHKQQIVYEEQR